MTRRDANFARRPVRHDGASAPSRATAALIVAALAACSAMALAGCEEQSYPTPSVEQTPPPPPPPPAPLMGAPAPPPPYAPCAQTPCGAPAQPPVAPRVIASTPVPNPPETAHPHRRRHDAYWLSGEAPPVARPHHAHQPTTDGRWHVVGPASAEHPKAAAAPRAVAHPHHTPPAKEPAAAPVAKPPETAAPTKAPPSTAANAPAQPQNRTVVSNINDDSAAPLSGPDADRYNSLQSALSNLIGIDAALATPDHFQTGQTVDVTLTLPADFAQQARDEAGKVGLTEAVSSVNIDAHLTGVGFTIVPDQAQAQPLLLAQSTVFHWRVTPTAAAVGAVKADLTADLLTVGHTLPLGSVQSQAGINTFHVSGRWVGVGLLVLVLVVVAAWLVSRTSKGPPFRRRDI